MFNHVAKLFINGFVSHYFSSAGGISSWESSIIYFQEGWNLIDEFPIFARKYFSANFMITLLTYYSDFDEKKFTDTADKYLLIQDEFFKHSELNHKRKYMRKDDSYIICYERLIYNTRNLDNEKAHEYYLRYQNFVLSISGDPLVRDKVYYYNLSSKYYQGLGDINKAIQYQDSII